MLECNKARSTTVLVETEPCKCYKDEQGQVHQRYQIFVLFFISVEKPKPKLLLLPITAGANSAMNQSQFLAITCNTLKAWEKRLVYGVIGFGFASHWLKIWLESFKPITKCSDHNHAITQLLSTVI